MQHGPFTVESTKTIYQNPWIAVREDHVTHSQGKKGLFGIVTMLPGSSVLAVDKQQYVYLVREYRYAVDRETIEAMSGGLDEGETPLQAAQRELAEELGLEAATWQELGHVDPFTMVVDSPNYLFLATDLTQLPGGRTDTAPEYIGTMHIPLVEAIRMVEAGQITHAGSCIVILKAARVLGV